MGRTGCEIRDCGGVGDGVEDGELVFGEWVGDSLSIKVYIV